MEITYIDYSYRVFKPSSITDDYNKKQAILYFDRVKLQIYLRHFIDLTNKKIDVLFFQKLLTDHLSSKNFIKRLLDLKNDLESKDINSKYFKNLYFLIYLFDLLTHCNELTKKYRDFSYNEIINMYSKLYDVEEDISKLINRLKVEFKTVYNDVSQKNKNYKNLLIVMDDTYEAEKKKIELIQNFMTSPSTLNKYSIISEKIKKMEILNDEEYAFLEKYNNYQHYQNYIETYIIGDPNVFIVSENTKEEMIDKYFLKITNDVVEKMKVIEKLKGKVEEIKEDEEKKVIQGYIDSLSEGIDENTNIDKKTIKKIINNTIDEHFVLDNILTSVDKDAKETLNVFYRKIVALKELYGLNDSQARKLLNIPNYKLKLNLTKYNQPELLLVYEKTKEYLDNHLNIIKYYFDNLTVFTNYCNSCSYTTNDLAAITAHVFGAHDEKSQNIKFQKIALVDTSSGHLLTPTSAVKLEAYMQALKDEIDAQKSKDNKYKNIDIFKYEIFDNYNNFIKYGVSGKYELPPSKYIFSIPVQQKIRSGDGKLVTLEDIQDFVQKMKYDENFIKQEYRQLQKYIITKEEFHDHLETLLSHYVDVLYSGEEYLKYIKPSVIYDANNTDNIKDRVLGGIYNKIIQNEFFKMLVYTDQISDINSIKGNDKDKNKNKKKKTSLVKKETLEKFIADGNIFNYIYSDMYEIKDVFPYESFLNKFMTDSRILTKIIYDYYKVFVGNNERLDLNKKEISQDAGEIFKNFEKYIYGKSLKENMDYFHYNLNNFLLFIKKLNNFFRMESGLPSENISSIFMGNVLTIAYTSKTDNLANEKQFENILYKNEQKVSQQQYERNISLHYNPIAIILLFSLVNDEEYQMSIYEKMMGKSFEGHRSSLSRMLDWDDNIISKIKNTGAALFFDMYNYLEMSDEFLQLRFIIGKQNYTKITKIEKKIKTYQKFLKDSQRLLLIKSLIKQESLNIILFYNFFDTLIEISNLFISDDNETDYIDYLIVEMLKIMVFQKLKKEVDQKVNENKKKLKEEGKQDVDKESSIIKYIETKKKESDEIKKQLESKGDKVTDEEIKRFRFNKDELLNEFLNKDFLLEIKNITGNLDITKEDLLQGQKTMDRVISDKLEENKKMEEYQKKLDLSDKFFREITDTQDIHDALVEEI